MKSNTKDKLIALLKDVPTQEPFVEDFITFIKSYDGTNENDLHITLMSAIGLLLEVEKLRINAKAYEKLTKIKAEIQKETSEVGLKLNTARSGKPPIQIAGSKH